MLFLNMFQVLSLEGICQTNDCHQRAPETLANIFHDFLNITLKTEKQTEISKHTTYSIVNV